MHYNSLNILVIIIIIIIIIISLATTPIKIMYLVGLFNIKFRSCFGTSILVTNEKVFLFMPVTFPWNQMQGASIVTFITGDTWYAEATCALGAIHIEIQYSYNGKNETWHSTCVNICCVHIKSSLARGYIPRAWREIKVTFIPAPMVNYSHIKAYCPISQLSFMHKTMQIWWQEYQGWSIGARSHICNRLPSNQGSPHKLQCTMWLHIYRKQ